MPTLANLRFIDVRRTTDPVRRRIRSRGVPPALAGREIFYSEDPNEASELIAGVLAPNRLTVDDPGGTGFAASLHGARLRDVTVLHLDLHVPAQMDTPVAGDYVAVHMPTNGTSMISSRTTASRPTRSPRLVTSAHQPVNIRLRPATRRT